MTIAQPGPNGHIAEDNLTPVLRLCKYLQAYASMRRIQIAALLAFPDAHQLNLTLLDDEDGEEDGVCLEEVAVLAANGSTIMVLAAQDFWSGEMLKGSQLFDRLNDDRNELRGRGQDVRLNLRTRVPPQVTPPFYEDVQQLLGQLSTAKIWRE